MNKFNRKYSVRVCLLRTLLNSHKPLYYRELIFNSGVNDNMSTRNVLSQIVKAGLVAKAGIPKHYRYSPTDKTEPYLQKLRNIGFASLRNKELDYALKLIEVCQ